jgi:hypothetical protein
MIQDIELLAKQFAGENETLTSVVQDMEFELDKVKRRFLPILRRHVVGAAAAKLALHTAVASAPELFERPKTVIFHGVKVGYRKGSGGIDWEDDAAVVARIEKLFPKAQAELLIKTTKKPIAKALEDLDVKDLKALGCRVGDTGEVVVIKLVDSEIEKAVAALLKDAVEGEVAA